MGAMSAEDSQQAERERERFFNHCEQHADKIPVRERIQDRWQAVYLSELSPERRRMHIAEMWEARRGGRRQPIQPPSP